MTINDVIDQVMLDLQEHFADLDDQEDAAFGEYARVERTGTRGMVVLHETEDWGIEIVVRPIDRQGGGKVTDGPTLPADEPPIW